MVDMHHNAWGGKKIQIQDFGSISNHESIAYNFFKSDYNKVLSLAKL
jgi:hypothetical protein